MPKNKVFGQAAEGETDPRPPGRVRCESSAKIKKKCEYINVLTYINVFSIMQISGRCDMTARDIVKEIMGIKNLSQSKLADMAGFKSQSNVTGILNRGSSMRVDNFEQMLSAMGYKIIVVPEEVTPPSDSYIVEEQK